MVYFNPKTFIHGALLIAAGMLFSYGQVVAQDGEKKIRVEIFLSGSQKSNADKIREQFKTLSIENVHFQFFRAGRPPANIAIGREVPVAAAQLALKMAMQYNQGVRFLLPQMLLPITWIGIGTSAFDEASQIPVSSVAVKELSDPSLTNKQFHALYRQLTQK